MVGYGGRWFPSAEYEGMQVPGAYPHDLEILPHQHERMEDFFPREYVPRAADADELVSEPDLLEQRGEGRGRGEDAPQTQTASTPPLVLRVEREALTLHASPAACVKLPQVRVAAVHALAARDHPSGTDYFKNRKSKQERGRLQVQNPPGL